MADQVSERFSVGLEDLKIKGRMNNNADSPTEASYKLSPEQAHFFKTETGIDDDEELKSHILDVQARAYSILPYLTIKGLTFLQLRIATLPEYKSIIKLGQERPDGILLDVGSCFGVDARKSIADGFPLKNVITTDLKKEFHDLGHTLFKTTPETYPLGFVHGDAFDPNLLRIVPPFEEPPLTQRPDLSSLTSLNPLAGRCAVIYVSNLFHLFSEENQLHLAKALAGLLSPEPGSIICGEHAGSRNRGVFNGEYEGLTFETFQHSPESWSALWNGEIFSKGKVRVNVKIVGESWLDGWRYDRLQWSVVRL